MAYSRQHSYVSFNARTAIIYVNVNLYDNATLIGTVSMYPIKLPVDSSGNVPTGSALNTFVSNVLVAVYNTRVLDEIKAIEANGGSVANAPTIYAITSASETQDPNIIYANTGIPVLLVPITSTASVMIPLSPNATVLDYNVLRSNLPTPGSVSPGTYELDNGNINGGDIVDIRGNTENTIPGGDSVYNIIWNYSSVPPSVKSAWPYIFETTGYNTNVSFVYIEHSPITINGSYGIGVFLYA